jgi:sialic acid synthase SpsE
MEFNIGKVTIGGPKTVIIAEAGVNHLGRMDYAEELIKTAARAGADIIKFQTYKAEKLALKTAPRFWNWDGEEKKDGSQFDSYSKLDSFERNQYEKLIELCDKYDIEFLSTPFDKEAVDMLVSIGMKGFKIASCDINNLPFISYIASKNLPILLSTGAAEINEIRRAVEVINKQGNNKICIMHCTLCYPTEPKDANLTAINDILKHFPEYVPGLSDHTLGTIIPAASVVLGAKVIEKHYTFDKTLPYSADHWLSLNEEELSELVEQVRILEQATGIGKKVRLDCEMPAFKYARRSIVTTKEIIVGETIREEHLSLKRPGTGLAPEMLYEIVGKKAKRTIPADSILSFEDIN